MFMELLAKLKIERAFALGTSQGGFIAARMALIAPEKVSCYNTPFLAV
jgi:microsomal epoxide hydrolase